MQTTIKEIGLATFMTSFTTSIGFASLMTSRLQTISDFGWNAAIGVMIAYITVLFLPHLCYLCLIKNRLSDKTIINPDGKIFLKNISNKFTKAKIIYTVTVGFLVLFVFGMMKISTNYNIEDNLPRGAKVTKDFKYFESNFAGFRPLEFAVTSKTEEKADDFNILKEVDKLEEK